MIVCAAIKIEFEDDRCHRKELVVCGHRHANCFKVIHELNKTRTISTVQGFINHKGEFLDRKEALAHALEIGQLSQTHIDYQRDNHINEMFSEDLY